MSVEAIVANFTQHFFWMLPEPFITLATEMALEMAAQFTPLNRWSNDNSAHLERIWALFKTLEERAILAKLCELLERQPEEGSQLFAKALTRRDVRKLPRVQLRLTDARVHSIVSFRVLRS